MRAQLIPLDGGAPIDIARDLTVVGRKEDCDFRLDHKSISKMHCVLVKTDGLLMLRDLGSTNGTRVNGQRIRRAALLPNDQVAFANFKYRVHLGPDVPSVSNEGQTQHMDAADVARLLSKKEYAERDEKVAEEASPVPPNRLPDVYPEGKPDGPDV
jgi:predicted component of type VI protein secretion system